VRTGRRIARNVSSEPGISQADARLELEDLIRSRDNRSTEVLMLRAAGYEWKEIAQVFQATVAAIRNSFWREIVKLRRGAQEAPRATSTSRNFRGS
jgi:DNA-directed RNA polymerase specialized sigma24 family protein